MFFKDISRFKAEFLAVTSTNKQIRFYSIQPTRLTNFPMAFKVSKTPFVTMNTKGHGYAEIAAQSETFLSYDNVDQRIKFCRFNQPELKTKNVELILSSLNQPKSELLCNTSKIH